MIPEITFVVASVLSCPDTKIINPSGEITQQDQEAFNRAKSRCPEIYPDSPCLKVFKKVEQGVYAVICGAADK